MLEFTVSLYDNTTSVLKEAYLLKQVGPVLKVGVTSCRVCPLVLTKAVSGAIHEYEKQYMT